MQEGWHQLEQATRRARELDLEGAVGVGWSLGAAVLAGDTEGMVILLSGEEARPALGDEPLGQRGEDARPCLDQRDLEPAAVEPGGGTGTAEEHLKNGVCDGIRSREGL